MNRAFRRLGYHVDKAGKVVPIVLEAHAKAEKKEDPQPPGCRDLRRKFPNLYAIMMGKKEAEKMAEIVKCRACPADIVWLKTKAGKNIPVDVPQDIFKPGSMYGKNPSTETMYDAVTTAVEYNPEYMVSHFATCPKANDFRKKKEAKP